MRENTAGTPRIRYEPNEKPGWPLSVALGLQSAVPVLVGTVVVSVITARSGSAGEPYVLWAVFAALVVGGLTTVLQSVRVGRLGAGHAMAMVSSGSFIAASATALRLGGPGLLASLVLASSCLQIALANRLSGLRRLLTPTVCGTIIMLIPAAVLPIAFAMLGNTPPDTPGHAVSVCFAVTLLVITVLTLRGSAAIRIWAPLIGIAAGSLASIPLDLHDFGRVAAADWVGVPTAGWPAVAPSFGPRFWALLPAFLFVALVNTMKTIGDATALQAASWRTVRAPDYRVAEGAVAVSGVGNLLCAVAGVMPNVAYSASASAVHLTGVAARRVGVCIGAVLLALAFCPKVVAILLSVPDAVISAYLVVLFALLFVGGVEMAVSEGMNLRRATIIGISFWMGVGFGQGAIVPGDSSSLWVTLLTDGISVGALTALVCTGFVELTGPRPRRLTTELDADAAPRIEAFLSRLADRGGWGDRSKDRLVGVAEEVFLLLLEEVGSRDKTASSRLRLTARAGPGATELEFVVAAGDTNIEDQLALLAGPAGTPREEDVSLRLLRHYARTVRHRKYHSVDIVTVTVDSHA